MSDFGQTLVQGLDYDGGVGVNATNISNFVSKPCKGDGLLHKANGQHILQLIANNLTANIQIEASLSRKPEDGPWIPVQLVSGMDNSISDTLTFEYKLSVPNNQYSGTPVKTNNFYTITGNYAWLRANVSDMKFGRIESIKIAF
jgi:hypothetical protein